MHSALSWQMDWRGMQLANLRLLVCPSCLDVPQPNGRKPVIVGPDPVPVRDPRPGFAFTQMNEAPGAAIRGSVQEILSDEQDVYWEPGVDFESDQDIQKEDQAGRWRFG